MRALDLKLWRDLWGQRGPVLAIALIVGSGLAVLVMSLSVTDSLEETRRAYYERYRFAHVFATATRAPDALVERIAAISGVGAVETRIVKGVILDVPGFPETATARLVSLPDTGEPRLNALAMRAGRLPRADTDDEVVIVESLADGHGLAVGDTIDAIINRTKRTLRIVGIALSPEFVYAIGPGALMPDEKRFGVVWMRREALAAAFDLDGAFNDVSLSLMRGVSREAVIDRLDILLDRYGGIGAHDRSDQISNWFVSNEIDQMRILATVLPAIFLGVAAFVLNAVIGRLIALERGQIGLLKAFGYGPLEIGWHYAKFVLVIAALGLVIGVIAGSIFGRAMTELYAIQFRFPVLIYRASPSGIAIAGAAASISSLAGAFNAIRGAMRLPPAEAMRPPAPPFYRRGMLAKLAVGLDQPTRMIARHLLHRPLRTLTAITGIAFALGVLITSLSWRDSIEHMVLHFFTRMQGQDITVTLTEAGGPNAAYALARLPGVLASEPFRAVPVRLRSGPVERLESLVSLPDHPRLFRPLDAEARPIAMPERGLLISSKLAELMRVGPGDTLYVEARTGKRPKAALPVVGTFDTLIGSPLYISRPALDRFMGDGERVSGAYLRVDPAMLDTFHRYLKRTPEIASVSSKTAALGEFRRTLDETMDIIVNVYVLFGSVIAFGVVYNAARVSLSERERDLASLRVLGFTRGEVAYILLGELALLSALALPLGCLVGFGLKALLTSQFDTELFRIPDVLDPGTYGTGALIGITAIASCSVIVRRKIDQLDLIAVLKTRD